MVEKVVDERGQIWVEQEGQQVRIGFTRDFLSTLDQCWHILPANNKQFKRKMPLMTVETNDGLVSILSPVDGFLQQFDKRAQNFPDRLTENDVILHLTTTKPAVAARWAGHGMYEDHELLPQHLRGQENIVQAQAIVRAQQERANARVAQRVAIPRGGLFADGIAGAVGGAPVWDPVPVMQNDGEPF